MFHLSFLFLQCIERLCNPAQLPDLEQSPALDTRRLPASDDLSLCSNDESGCQDATGTNIISYQELLLTAVVKVNSIFI